MKIDVSNGELLDKISILEIKHQKLEDLEKLKNVQEELDLLIPCLKVLDLYLDSEEYTSLTEVNSELWELEDEIRLKEQRKNFDWDFITCARQIYMLNDKRAMIKRKINLVTNSHVVEEKSHKEIE
tara:strand:- start:1981 stop:2358 length:378 start_codon:yes stop_codon:yes gene_type:complete